MPEERDIALVDELRSRASELSSLEFKQNNDDPAMIGKLCSAIANAALLDEQPCGYVLWGIDNDSHEVVGTTFNPDSKTVGTQVFQLWLANKLQPCPAFGFRMVDHPNGRVVLLEIPAPTQAPVAYEGVPYVRIGSATPKLTDYPEMYSRVIEKMRPYTWESGFAMQYVTSDDVLSSLDYSAYFRLTQQPLPDNRSGILEKLTADALIKSDVGGRWNITNMGALLFAVELDRFGPSMARKGVRFIAYDGTNRAETVIHRHDEKKGYACGFEGLLSYINNLLPGNEHIGQALRQSRPLFPELSVREVVANALIHQDLTISGMGPQIELFSDRIEITNPGKPLMQTDRMIDLPPRSRNEAIASLMRRMRMCEEQGSGLDKVFFEVELFQLPAPLMVADDRSMQVVIFGPRSFADMSAEERTRACYFHAVLRYVAGERMRNSSLCDRLGIERKNAAQATSVINQCLEAGHIKYADPDHKRAGYFPYWA